MTTMTRQHFQLVADLIHDQIDYVLDQPIERRGTAARANLGRLAAAAANTLADTNPEFNRMKFLAACDPDQKLINA